MEIHQGPAAPASGNDNNDQPPSIEELARDPEVAALLEFAPVPRRFKKQGGWSAEMQRLFIARLTVHGSPGRACDELGMYRSGVDKVAKCPGSHEFKQAWKGAVALAERRRARGIAAGHSGMGQEKMPFIDHRHKWRVPMAAPEAEDPDEMARQAEEARDRISQKLLLARRLYLQEIADSPGKRAAFEILTGYPIDWDRADKLQAQDDEPWRIPNMRKPDMLLTAENGWLGDFAHGQNKMARLREVLIKHREEHGMAPIKWEEEGA